MADPTTKRIQLKDKSGNLLYPNIQGASIPDKGIALGKLEQNLQDKLNGVATSADLTALQNTVNTLNGADTVQGSVKQQIGAAVSSLVGTAPDTLNTLQKIAQEMQDPSKNTAATVLDQVAGKANTADLTSGTLKVASATKADTASNADTVNNHTVAANVPANAKFTDTVYDDTSVKSRLTALENSEITYEEVTD